MAILDVLQTLVGQEGRVRRSSCMVRVTAVVAPDKLEIKEIDDNQKVVNGGMCRIVAFSEFYQGSEVEDDE